VELLSIPFIGFVADEYEKKLIGKETFNSLYWVRSQSLTKSIK